MDSLPSETTTSTENNGRSPHQTIQPKAIREQLARILVAHLQGDYEEALANAKRLNMPHMYVDPLIRAAALGQLGRVEVLRKM